jgi:hypothetical protein
MQRRAWDDGNLFGGPHEAFDLRREMTAPVLFPDSRPQTGASFSSGQGRVVSAETGIAFPKLHGRFALAVHVLAVATSAFGHETLHVCATMSKSILALGRSMSILGLRIVIERHLAVDNGCHYSRKFVRSRQLICLLCLRASRLKSESDVIASGAMQSMMLRIPGSPRRLKPPRDDDLSSDVEPGHGFATMT